MFRFINFQYDQFENKLPLVKYEPRKINMSIQLIG